MTDTTTRDEIAAANGIPAHMLRGDTRAELEEHAAALTAAGIGTTLTPTQIVDRALGKNTADIDTILDQAIGH